MFSASVWSNAHALEKAVVCLLWKAILYLKQAKKSGIKATRNVLLDTRKLRSDKNSEFEKLRANTRKGEISFFDCCSNQSSYPFVLRFTLLY